MVKEEIIQLAAGLALGTGALGALTEWLHVRRVRRLSRLAFGPTARPRAWTVLAAPLRVIALAALVWGLTVLVAFEGASRNSERTAAATRHLLVLLDVSPSMQLVDGGEKGTLKRSARAAEVLRSVMERAASAEVKITMASFYTDALPLVKECSDREVIWNFADDLPLHIAYRPGKTDLVKSLNTAGELVKDFPRKSTTVLVLTDGDTVPDSGLKPMPSAVAQIIFAGVGSESRGAFIDGHLSRQDGASLSQLARRMGGQYHNSNVKQVPSELLQRLTAPDERDEALKVNLRVLAIIVTAVSASLLALLPLLLEYLGSAWKVAGKVPTPSSEEVSA